MLPALLLVVALAFLVEAALGFGATVVAVTLGALVFPLETLLPALVLLNLLLSLFVLGKDARAADRRLLRRLLPLMALGLPVGLLTFHWAAPGLLRGLLGVLVATLALLELARARRAQAEPARALPRPLGALLLVLAGVVHGLFGTGGPLAVYVVGRELPDKRAFRATLAVLWLLLNLLLLSAYAASGRLGAESLALVPPLLLALVAGGLLGDLVHRRVDPARFRVAVFGLLLGSGLTLALSA